MRPLAWRAPIIPITGKIDLEPLLDSMVDSDEGCVFRDFEVRGGKPHTISNAVEWANSAASHDTIVKSIREILDDPSVGGHDSRHVMPEIGRALGLPRHLREALGYWRGEKIVADTPDDKRAIARAVTRAREQRGRAGRLAACSDRYASVDAEPVEQDATRAACLLAAREQLAVWGDDIPSSSRDQIEAIAASAKAATKTKPKAKRAAKRATVSRVA